MPPTPVRQASICKVLEFLISFLKFFVLPEKTGRKVMNQSMSFGRCILSVKCQYPVDKNPSWDYAFMQVDKFP